MGDRAIVGVNVRYLGTSIVVTVTTSDRHNWNTQTRDRRGHPTIIEVRHDAVPVPCPEVWDATKLLFFHIKRPMTPFLIGIGSDAPNNSAIVRRAGIDYHSHLVSRRHIVCIW